jgi:hypothetical protein
MENLEILIGKIGAALAVALGMAMAAGLLTAGGHVTW